MKNFVKLIMPIAAFMLASAGAVTTANSSSKSEGGAIQGWRRISQNNCVSPVMCNNVPSTLCTTAGFPAKGKVGLDCTQDLYHTVTP